MAENTKIAWSDHTFNPWVGCQKVSDGCTRCYAEAISLRFGQDVWGPNRPRQRTSETYWRQPLTWNRKAEKKFAATGEITKVFCGSMCDWAEDHKDVGSWRDDLFELIQQTPYLTWLLLTKRAKNIFPFMLGGAFELVPKNVWLGVSIESHRELWRADILRNLPAPVRFISYEPALGPLDGMCLNGIDWVIYGGESGHGHRPHNLDWARSMRDRCTARGIPFFYKQGSALAPGQDDLLDGKTIKQFPGGV